MAGWNQEKLPFRTTTVHSIMPSLTTTTTMMMMKENHCVTPPKKSSPIDRLKRIFHFREENSSPKSTKNGKKKQSKVDRTIQWQEDEKAVRAGTCTFHLKYLGSIEVQESRGIHVCEQAIQSLMNFKNKHIKAVLHISGDTLRVVDEINKGIVVDQTIEKVSFCAPHRRHEKGFAYICRDGATRRWLCHAFLTIKQTGEHLSHTVGCAFQICLERKQKRDRDCQVSIEYRSNDTSYTRLGSFRPTSITERIIDPQSAQIAEPVPPTPPNDKSIERPRPKSCAMDVEDCRRNLFKRQSSDLPSIQENKSFSRTSEKILSLCRTTPFSVLEDNEVSSTINEIPKLSLGDSTNTFAQYRPKKFSNIPFSSSQINENLFRHSLSDSFKPSITDVFHSNLLALAQSNYPTNPFTPYAYSMSIYAQSPNGHSDLFTPKRGTNPFDDDLIRR